VTTTAIMMVLLLSSFSFEIFPTAFAPFLVDPSPEEDPSVLANEVTEKDDTNI